MILKASQRGSGQNLAAHLLRTDDNEHVLVHDLRGFASDDLHGAFKEAEAVSQGTKCRQYLFSLSLNPPEAENVPVWVFEDAIERIEGKLKLEGQPRAIVFHEKEGRRHAHCVWSRIDAETMTARQMSFFKQKLMGVSRDLYLENGWKMPRGLENAAERNPTNFSLAEWQQAKRQDIDPRWLKTTLQHCWARSDNGRSFARSLEEHGFFLARGDRRGFVVLDHNGEVWSLARSLDLKSKEVAARLGDAAALPGVEVAKASVGARMTPAIRRHVEESRARFQKRSAALGQRRMEMTHRHRAARGQQKASQEVQWQQETRARAERLPKGLRGLWHRITGRYQQIRSENEREAQRTQERHAGERQTMIDRQRDERAVLQKQFREMRSQQAALLLELRKDIGRYLRMARARADSAALSNRRGSGLRLQR